LPVRGGNENQNKGGNDLTKREFEAAKALAASQMKDNKDMMVVLMLAYEGEEEDAEAEK